MRGALGAAHYRLQDWRQAQAALEKALSLHKLEQATPGSLDYCIAANHGFVLAMAHWQLGEKKTARAQYDKALHCMDNGIKGFEETNRLRAEAAALLGIVNQ